MPERQGGHSRGVGKTWDVATEAKRSECEDGGGLAAEDRRATWKSQQYGSDFQEHLPWSHGTDTRLEKSEGQIEPCEWEQ